MKDMPLLKKAARIATRAHGSQKEKNGRPYINHPVRVMRRLRTEADKTVATRYGLLNELANRGQSLSAC